MRGLDVLIAGVALALMLWCLADIVVDGAGSGLGTLVHLVAGQ